MLTVEHYFGKFTELAKDEELFANATGLLRNVNMLLSAYVSHRGSDMPINPSTGNIISGSLYGGIRPLDCPQGAAKSSHKKGLAVDIYDPKNELDAWLNDITLLKFNLYREHPDSTPHWCHLTINSPASGHRTFKP